MYQIAKDRFNIDCGVFREDGAFIPFCEDNTDYQKYLEWLAEGNEPLPADTGATA